MTTPLIEAIARNLWMSSTVAGKWEDIHDSEREPYIIDADVALTAITEAGMVICPREPTPKIVEAVWKNIPMSSCIDTQDVDAATSFYRAMISAAQGDGA